jgi:hypothetical protein
LLTAGCEIASEWAAAVKEPSRITARKISI